MNFKMPTKKLDVLGILKSAGFKTQSKHQLPPVLSNNQSAIGSVWNEEKQRWSTLLNNNHNFVKFADELSNHYNLTQPGLSTKNEYPFFEADVIVSYTDKVVNRVYTSPEQFLMIDTDQFHLWFHPWNDGVMLYSINIKEDMRGKGIGTQVMNFLFDISEQTNCPIYLVPFPDDNHEPTEMISKINKLKSWYSKLDFGPVDETNVVWCNFD